VLIERGLDARKVAEEGTKPTWAFEVENAHATDAIRILAELGLPRPKNEGFADVFGKGSLVPTPTEERALYLQALSGELARTLEAVEGVTSARVHLVIPAPPRPGQPAVPAKASAFVKVRPGAAEKVGLAREELRALVAGSVEGLTPEAVTIVVNEVSTSVVPEKRERLDTAGRLRLLVIALAAALSGLALGMVVLALRLRHLRRLGERVKAPAAPPRPVVSSSVSRRVA
jgi:type III secretion protein J